MEIILLSSSDESSSVTRGRGAQAIDNFPSADVSPEASGDRDFALECGSFSVSPGRGMKISRFGGWETRHAGVAQTSNAEDDPRGH